MLNFAQILSIYEFSRLVSRTAAVDYFRTSSITAVILSLVLRVPVEKIKRKKGRKQNFKAVMIAQVNVLVWSIFFPIIVISRFFKIVLKSVVALRCKSYTFGERKISLEARYKKECKFLVLRFLFHIY